MTVKADDAAGVDFGGHGGRKLRFLVSIPLVHELLLNFS